MASKLFLVLKSPSEWCGLEALGSLAHGQECGIVLLNDGVLFALKKEKLSALREHCSKVYAMQDDLQARGVHMVEGIKDIDYPRLVEMIMDDYEQTVTL